MTDAGAGCRTKFFSMLKNIRNSEPLYLGNEYAFKLPSASTTAATNDRMRMSSPGGEDTGEGGQFYANGAHILIRRRNLSHTRSSVTLALLIVNLTIFCNFSRLLLLNQG